MAHLVTYSSSAQLLEAVTPHILPHREWQSHFLLGLNLENLENEPNPNDFYAATWVGDELQIATFYFHKMPINLTYCREAYDMRFFDQQVHLLADYISSRSQESVFGYSSIVGPDEITPRITALLAEALNRTVTPILTSKESYIDRKKFIPIPTPDPNHVIRRANYDDDIDRLANLLQMFQDTIPVIQPLPHDELKRSVLDHIRKGSYYIYVLPNGKIPALAMVRRPTSTGICITMLISDKENRGKGYGGALISWVIDNALTPVEQGGRGRDHVCISWDVKGSAGRIYKRLGFVEGKTLHFLRLEPSVEPSDTSLISNKDGLTNV